MVKTTGDGVHAAFPNASEAVVAAIDAQLSLASEDWGDARSMSVRIGIHTGEAEQRGGDYYGPALNQAARLMAAGHGGQVLISGSTELLVRQLLPDGVSLVDAGTHSLRDLQDPVQIFQLVHPDLRAEFPPLRTLDAHRGNLPPQVTTFIGREAEIAAVADRVRRSPLVTLTGVGGVGKTRLALEVAAEVVVDFPDGAWLCEFAPVTDAGAVWETLAASLRVQSSPVRALEESVLEYLAPKRALLVLDNCEHLLDAIARQVDAIAHRCPRVAVLATSREGLALAGERIVAVPSLRVPEDDADRDELMQADAVRLFVDRANAAKSDFALTDRNAGAVAVVCRRLDGIPLAIELAAARVRSMSVEDLVARLDQRFKLLTRGSRAALERHQTLRNTIDWSYDLLDPREREALNGLSRVRGRLRSRGGRGGPGERRARRHGRPRPARAARRQVAGRRRRERGRRRPLPAARDHPPVRAGAPRSERRSRCRATPPCRPLHRGGRDRGPAACGAAVRSSGLARSRATPTTSAWRSTGPSETASVGSRASSRRTADGDAARDRRRRDGLGRDRERDPGAASNPLYPMVAAWASWGATKRATSRRAEELVAAAEDC